MDRGPNLDLWMATAGPHQPRKGVFYTQKFLSQHFALLAVLLKHLPYLLDCKPRLIKFFFHHVCGLNSRAAYIFLCDADILSDALSFTVYAFTLSTNLSQVLYNTAFATGECRLTQILLYANSRTFTSNHTLIFVPTQIPKTHIDTSTVYAAYIQGRLTLNLSHAAYNQGRLTIKGG